MIAVVRRRLLSAAQRAELAVLVERATRERIDSIRAEIAELRAEWAALLDDGAVVEAFATRYAEVIELEGAFAR